MEDIKLILAEKASEFVEENELIFIDSGTTMFELAKIIVHKKITIFTNNNLLKSLIKNKARIVFLKGDLDERTQSIFSEEALKRLKELHFDKSFFGFNSIANNHFTTSSRNEARIKSLVVKQSKKSFALGQRDKSFDGAKISFGSTADIQLISD